MLNKAHMPRKHVKTIGGGGVAGGRKDTASEAETVTAPHTASETLEGAINQWQAGRQQQSLATVHRVKLQKMRNSSKSAKITNCLSTCVAADARLCTQVKSASQKVKPTDSQAEIKEKSTFEAATNLSERVTTSITKSSSAASIQIK